MLSRLALLGGEVWVTGGVLFLGENRFTDCCIGGLYVLDFRVFFSPCVLDVWTFPVRRRGNHLELILAQTQLLRLEPLSAEVTTIQVLGN